MASRSHPTWSKLGLHKQIFYHGTSVPNALNILNSGQFNSSDDENLYGAGAYVTANPRIALNYSRGSGVVLAMHLNPEHPAFGSQGGRNIRTAIPTSGVHNTGKADVWVPDYGWSYGPDRLSRYNPERHNPIEIRDHVVVRPGAKIMNIIGYHRSEDLKDVGLHTPAPLSNTDELENSWKTHMGEVHKTQETGMARQGFTKLNGQWVRSDGR